MKSAIFLPRLAVLSVIFTLAISTHAQTKVNSSSAVTDEEQVRAVVTRFRDGYVRADVQDVMKLWSPKSTDPGARGPGLVANFADFQDPVLKKFVIHKVLIAGDTAKAWYTIRFVVNSKKTGKPIRGFPDQDIKAIQTLVKENGEWHVMTDDRATEEFGKQLTGVADPTERENMLREYEFLVDDDLVNFVGGQALDAVFERRDYTEALSLLQFALPLGEKVGSKKTLALLHSYFGLVYEYLGDYGLALIEDTRYKELSEEDGYAGGVANALNRIAGDYTNLGQHDRALDAIQKAMAVKVDGKIPIDRPARLNANLANEYVNVGNYDKAIESYQFVLDYAEKNKLDRWRLTAYDGLAKSFEKKGEHVNAEQYANKALELVAASADAKRDKGHVLEVTEHAAEIALALGKFNEALDLAERASAAGSEFKFDDLLWRPKLLAARALLGMGNVDRARSALNESISIIEKSGKKSLGGEDNLQSVLAERSEPYKLMAALNAAQGRSLEAISYADKARARVLLSTMSGPRVSATQIMSVEERKADISFSTRLSELNRSLDRLTASPQSDKQKTADLRKSVDDLRNEYEVFRTKIVAAHPELKVRLGDVRPIDNETLNKVLTDNRSMIVEYMITAQASYVFTISKDRVQKLQFKTFSLPNVKASDLKAEAALFRAALSAGDLSFPRRSMGLYDKLVKPIAAELTGKTNIILIPDGPMWEMPMLALQNSRGQYLVEQASISYAPSISVLQEMNIKVQMRTRTTTSRSELLAFGNPRAGSQTQKRLEQVYMDEKLEPLPEAERLVNTLAKMYGPTRSKVYTGAAAREETAKTEAPKYRIVQFATHGILNDVSPMYSHLVLAQDEKDPNEDGLLEAWELKDLDLKADLVILSACDTARGRVSAGEGIIGMTWAAFIAGAPTTVASQWKVESTSTTELMIEFHRQLLTGKVSKAEALRRAQLKLMRDPKYKHPSYWAAWVIVGDAS